MAATELKNIFLSASIPLPDRDSQYFETADIIAIRDAIIALTTVVLPHHRIIWGGHPSITPLIYYVMTKLNLNTQEHVRLYQSRFFEEDFPEDNESFTDIVFTENLKDSELSKKRLRERMLDENNFVAGIFIGGMEGILAEHEMFKERFPDAIILPIASTGAATKIIYDQFLHENDKNKKLIKDYGYMSLFQELLMDKI
ncbi:MULTISPECIES: hypothetical protein [unclassified Chryseobacterium]|uniref:SLOG domain-containing protein n=1 Tax=unclassified Chryseobacterium TaxID=2593645 RepID=UPI000D35D499|nr:MULTISPECIES: hypothetical protein [unclassified Chryseobacterium]PTT73798.1 hypothetical protein DBR25_12190 [Chryseobacterium sp. HMWF001]PVV50783.1 hypothetical protein DD829_21505 [Chryseobacterium sp. HMWF035]